MLVQNFRISSSQLSFLMEHIKTTCPTCQTKYLVSMMHLSVAQGKVCCSHCRSTFNAYHHMMRGHLNEEELSQSNFLNIAKYSALEVFHTRNASSSINLLTHLNHTRHSEVNIRATTSRTPHKRQPKWASLLLIVLGSVLILILLFNILTHNTKVLHQFPFWKSITTNKCTKKSCSSTTQDMVQIQVLKVEESSPYVTTVTGFIQNLSPDVQQLPQIELNVHLTKTRIKPFQFSPEMYLPYYFRHKNVLLKKQRVDFRLDVPFSYNNVHSLEIKQSMKSDAITLSK